MTTALLPCVRAHTIGYVWSFSDLNFGSVSDPNLRSLSDTEVRRSSYFLCQKVDTRGVKIWLLQGVRSGLSWARLSSFENC